MIYIADEAKRVGLPTTETLNDLLSLWHQRKGATSAQGFALIRILGEVIRTNNIPISPAIEAMFADIRIKTTALRVLEILNEQPTNSNLPKV